MMRFGYWFLMVLQGVFAQDPVSDLLFAVINVTLPALTTVLNATGLDLTTFLPIRELCLGPSLSTSDPALLVVPTKTYLVDNGTFTCPIAAEERFHMKYFHPRYAMYGCLPTSPPITTPPPDDYEYFVYGDGSYSIGNVSALVNLQLGVVSVNVIVAPIIDGEYTDHISLVVRLVQPVTRAVAIIPCLTTGSKVVTDIYAVLIL